MERVFKRHTLKFETDKIQETDDLMIMPVGVTVQGVANGAYKPPEEIDAALEYSDNTYVTWGHPDDWILVSNRAEVKGLLKNTSVRDVDKKHGGKTHKLRQMTGELHVEKSKVADYKLDAIREGIIKDTSIGFWSWDEWVEPDDDGNWPQFLGEEYYFIEREILLDHIAILDEDETPACANCPDGSGCGMLGSIEDLETITAGSSVEADPLRLAAHGQVCNASAAQFIPPHFIRNDSAQNAKRRWYNGAMNANKAGVFDEEGRDVSESINQGHDPGNADDGEGSLNEGSPTVPGTIKKEDTLMDENDKKIKKECPCEEEDEVVEEVTDTEPTQVDALLAQEKAQREAAEAELAKYKEAELAQVKEALVELTGRKVEDYDGLTLAEATLRLESANEAVAAIINNQLKGAANPDTNSQHKEAGAGRSVGYWDAKKGEYTKGE